LGPAQSGLRDLSSRQPKTSPKVVVVALVGAISASA
jgi:hypothetical protein